MAGFLSPFDREQTFDSQLEKVHSLFRRQLAIPLYGKTRASPLWFLKCFGVCHVIRPFLACHEAKVAGILIRTGQRHYGRVPW